MSLQQSFDNHYISSSEICNRLGIARSTLLNGIRAGKLPEHIVIRRANGEGAHILLFERQAAEPMMQSWSVAIQARKGQ